MKNRIFFISFEGTDGVGKSTHIQLLKKWLKTKKKKVVLTREPGGGIVSEKIRKILLDPKSHMDHLTELFLYQSARAEHVSKTIKPALANGSIVLCDRFTDATMAYQGFARKLNLGTIKSLNAIATQGIHPQLTIWLDISPKVGLNKAQRRTRSKKGDRLENEGLQFQKQVRKGYQYMARQEPKRFVRIAVQKSIDDTQKLIRELIQKKLKI